VLVVGVAVGLLLADNTDTIDINVKPTPMHNNNRRVVKYVLFFCSLVIVCRFVVYPPA
jgi:hypothetical protein